MIVRFIWLVGPNVGLVFPESKLEGVLCESIEVVGLVISSPKWASIKVH